VCGEHVFVYHYERPIEDIKIPFLDVCYGDAVFNGYKLEGWKDRFAHGVTSL
jgi:hypothetical protein